MGRKRPRNEDAFLCRPDAGIFAVADGMGGHAGGDVASRTVLAAIATFLSDERDGAPRMNPTSRVRAAIEAAWTALVERAHSAGLPEMGTTATLLVLGDDGRGSVAHVGDSRLYRMRAGRLAQLTRDHTWVQEQVDAGALPPERARLHPWAPVLTRVLTAHQPAAPDLLELELEPDDRLLLCTDGLSGVLESADIAALLALPNEPAELAERLVEAANARGGPDNITVIVLQRTA